MAQVRPPRRTAIRSVAGWRAPAAGAIGVLANRRTGADATAHHEDDQDEGEDDGNDESRADRMETFVRRLPRQTAPRGPNRARSRRPMPPIERPDAAASSCREARRCFAAVNPAVPRGVTRGPIFTRCVTTGHARASLIRRKFILGIGADIPGPARMPQSDRVARRVDLATGTSA